MTRTQIYLPDNLHHDLLAIARTHGKTLSELIREGAHATVKKYTKKTSSTKSDNGMPFFANLSKESNIHVKTSAVDLVRQHRD